MAGASQVPPQAEPVPETSESVEDVVGVMGTLATLWAPPRQEGGWPQVIEYRDYWAVYESEEAQLWTCIVRKPTRDDDERQARRRVVDSRAVDPLPPPKEPRPTSEASRKTLTQYLSSLRKKLRRERKGGRDGSKHGQDGRASQPNHCADQAGHPNRERSR